MNQERRRRDAGILQVTERDLVTLTWIAEQYCVSYDHIQKLLALYTLATTTHLLALGAPVPDLPPFDASKYEPMPEVEIDPPDEEDIENFADDEDDEV